MFDSHFDEPWMDFCSVVDQLSSGICRFPDTRLYTILNPEFQQQIDEAPTMSAKIDELKNAYGFQNVRSFWDSIDLSKIIPSKYANETAYIQDSIDDIRDRFDTYDRAVNDRDWLTYENCVLQKGTSHLIQFLMLIVFRRFHKDFKIDKFLASWIRHETHDDDDIPSDNLIVRQMIASRINYVIHGTYLPIVTVVNTLIHATAYLLLPRVSRGRLVWNVISINSNGDAEFKSQLKFFRDALQTYENWVSPQQENATAIVEIFCWDDIQKQYGTCVVWSLTLAFQFFGNYSRFSKKTNARAAVEEDDDGQDEDETTTIETYCQELAKRMSFYLIINRFNNYLNDLLQSFRYLFFEIFEKYGIDKFKTLSYLEESVYAFPGNRTIRLNFAILDKVEKIQKYLAKYIDNPAKFTRLSIPPHLVGGSAPAPAEEYETDDETPEESLRNEELRSQLLAEEEKQRAADERKIAQEKKRLEEESYEIAIRNGKLKRLKKNLIDRFKSSQDFFIDNYAFSEESLHVLLELSNLLSGDETTTVTNFESITYIMPNEAFIRKMIQDKNDAECKYAAERIELFQNNIEKYQENIYKIEGELTNETDIPDAIQSKKTEKLQKLKDTIEYNRLLLPKMKEDLEVLQSLDVDAEVEKFKVFIAQSVNHEKSRASKRSWSQR